MKYSEFRKWLREQGVDIKPGNGSHFRLTLNGKISTFPDHGSKEIGKGLAEQIKKQLGLK
ncbi:type II toxin-antitoxin system HicA family toxin [Caballeronia novacaledonica]|jgi:mRNA interferase HicA|uniref:Type II toxin-antitoxin system HicA family toxin n=1 Tax=Caballeronia novacaledonica TaxID=1544861 RepID=A0AA37I704_9BURK|nr:type II toxin-antitoxin system HicA family toxin [Caballeronia novacaledonica]GJH23632.1 type II toxin-antitoxin system HicA family toxin [Caballeronia novacaledonica]